MASYQARQRDPLLDQHTQAAIERRGKELVGIVLLAMGIATALIIGSYSPDDPSWLAATDEPAQNLLGRFGAAIASPLYVISGYGSWGLALVFAVWGVRLIVHAGEDRALSRVIFAPIAIALLSVYASTHAPGAGWLHSFGLGGLFGDTVLGAVLGIAPLDAGLSLKIVSALIGLGSLAMLSFVLGFDRRELAMIARFLLVGTIVGYDWILRMLGRGAVASLRGAQALNERRRARQDEEDDWAEPEMPAPALSRRANVLRAEPRFAGPVTEQEPAAAPRAGLLGKVGALLRGGSEADMRIEPELVERGLPRMGWTGEAPSADRIRERIADAVKYARGRRGFSPSGRAGGYGTMKPADYRMRSDETSLFMAQIEDEDALNHLGQRQIVELRIGRRAPRCLHPESRSEFRMALRFSNRRACLPQHPVRMRETAGDKCSSPFCHWKRAPSGSV